MVCTSAGVSRLSTWRNMAAASCHRAPAQYSRAPSRGERRSQPPGRSCAVAGPELDAGAALHRAPGGERGIVGQEPPDSVALVLPGHYEYGFRYLREQLRGHAHRGHAIGALHGDGEMATGA